jgi:hypothetical protein
MKKLLALSLFCICYGTVSAQTDNIFPAAGNVGIGTVNPASKLEVQTAGNGWPLSLRANAFNPGEINGLKFYSGYIGDDKWAGIASVAEDLHSNKTALSFYAGQTEKMRLSWDGNLGLGTLNPSAKLDISLGAGASNGTVGLKIGSIDNYPSLELGVENNYDAQIRTFGNDLNIYAGHFRTIGSTSTEDHKINFYTSKNGSTNWNTVKMVLTADGQLGIGTTTPREKLSVNGNIRAKEIKVEATNWPDYVFEEGYNIGTLKGLESYIKANKHLPEIPSAKDAEANGVELGEMNKLLLKKIEELTLHLIEKDKELNKERERINKLENALEKVIKKTN